MGLALVFVVCIFGYCGMVLLAFVHVHASFGVRNPSTIWLQFHSRIFYLVIFI